MLAFKDHNVLTLCTKRHSILWCLAFFVTPTVFCNSFEIALRQLWSFQRKFVHLNTMCIFSPDNRSLSDWITYRGYRHCLTANLAWYKHCSHPSIEQFSIEMLSTDSTLTQMKRTMLGSTVSRSCTWERGNREMCKNSHYPGTLQEKELKQWHLLHWPPISWLSKLNLPQPFLPLKLKIDARGMVNTFSIHNELCHLAKV